MVRPFEVLDFEVLDFYSTRRPVRLPAILPWFRQKEVSFFREKIMPTPAAI
jgi:hypothetical protein